MTRGVFGASVLVEFGATMGADFKKVVSLRGPGGATPNGSRIEEMPCTRISILDESQLLFFAFVDFKNFEQWIRE